MFVNVQFPPEIGYRGSTNRWFLDEGEGWTIGQLCEDICYAARIVGYHLELNGNPLVPDALATDVLSDEDTIDVVLDP